MRGVVLGDERYGVDADGARQGADMPAGIDAAATAGEVVLFDRMHDRNADAGGRTDLIDGQSRVDTGLLE
ncbi:hypothetical protein GCM10020000_21370 [Streptomyces olivoverticillatus]